jgi:hypothetical protein
MAQERGNRPSVDPDMANRLAKVCRKLCQDTPSSPMALTVIWKLSNMLAAV